MRTNYPLSTNSWGAEEREAMMRVFDSGRSTAGPEVEAFEREFADHVGTEYAVLVNSGGSANLLMVAVLVATGRLRAGDRIAVPANSWSTTYWPLVQHGLVPILVDIDKSYNIDVDQVRQLSYTSNLRAVLAVNLLGVPANLPDLHDLCVRHGWLLIEDNCESFGASIAGRQCGTWGALGTFSTFFSHHLNTGEGGVVVTGDKVIAEALRSMRAHGWSRELGRDHPYFQSIGEFHDPFTFVLPGYSMRPTEFIGAVGRVQLRRWKEQHVRRLHNYTIFKNLLSEFVASQEPHKSSESTWFGFGFTVSDRDILAKSLARAGVAVRPIVGGNFAAQPIAGDLIGQGKMEVFGKLTNCTRNHFNGMFIGNDDRNLEEQLNIVRDVVKAHYSGMGARVA